MNRLINLSFLVLLAVISSPCSEDPFHVMQSEQVGPLRIGLSAEEVRAAVPVDPQMGPLEEWGADGLFHQDWFFEELGITLGMVSDREESGQSVHSVTVTSPCAFSTKKGIHIGSSESDVLSAYKKDVDGEMTQAGRTIVVGSVYGGMIFTLSDGNVSKIFLGAAAE